MRRLMTPEEVLAIYEDAGGVWFFDHEGDPTAPHAELTSGLCSDGYVNSAPALADPATVAVLAEQLLARLDGRGICGNVDWVVGSPYAAITLSYELARQLGAKHGFAEKDPGDPRRMLWKRLIIPHNEAVLQCEELITTVGTTLEMRRAIREGNQGPVQFLPTVAAAVYRPASFGSLPENVEIVSLVAREVRSWKPEECPLCKGGSRRLRPKQHWRELTGNK